jgi:hypothetical protein
MTARTWIRKLFARMPRTIRKEPALRRLRLEALEGRWLPSTFTVTDTSDSATDTGSLRYALANVAAGDMIDFAPAVRSITLTSNTTLTINTNLSIVNDQGAGPVTIDGNDSTTVFTVLGSTTASLSGLTITHGHTKGLSDGGGIINYGTLTVSNSTLSGNSATSEGGGIENYNGTLTVSNSTLSGNSATGNGGGIGNYKGMVTVNNSTLSGNSSTADGGGIFNGGTLTVNNSTLSDDSATGNGGGISNGGTLTVSNSTLSRNSSTGDGGGIVIYHSTYLTLQNSIVSKNTAGGSGLDIDASGVLTDKGHNLLGSALNPNAPVNSTAGATGPGDIFSDSPGLAALADNGGPTKTMALQINSPAIDAGDNSLVPAVVTTDQRGYARVSGGTVDIGAYEVQEPTPSPASLPDGTYGTVYPKTTITATEATGGAGGPFTFAITKGSPPAGLVLGSDGTLSGTPTTPGSATFTITATDGGGYTGSETFTLTIAKASSTTTVSLGSEFVNGAVTYDGNAHGATAKATGAGGLSASLTVSYLGINGTTYDSTAAPTKAGQYKASASYAGDANHTASSASTTFTIVSWGQATGNIQSTVDAAAKPQGTQPALLTQGMQSSLDSQLQAAAAYFNTGDTADAVSQLQAFINHVNAQKGKLIDAGLAKTLIDAAQEIINAVG